MTINLTINGVVYPFPEPDDESWGQNVTDWAQAATGGMLQKAGGNFSLTADANFGATYGLVSAYFKSRQSNISTAGALRLARADVIGWRDQANAANLELGVDTSDRLTFDGTPVQNVLSVTDTATIDLTLVADVLSADVIAGSLTNTQINAAAAIARTKLASGTADHVLINSALGVMSSEAQLAISRGGTGQGSKTAAFDALSPATTKGDVIVFDGTDNIRLGVGTDGFVLGADSGETSGLAWISVLTNPMDDEGQLIYGGLAGAATKLAAGTSNQMLKSNGAAAPTWALIVNANVDAAAAIAYSKLALTGSIVNADVSGSAAIAYSKLSLTGSIVNADISASAAIAYSKLNLTGTIVNADVSASAAIAYSKLALSGSIVNADISGSAAIAYSKLSLSDSILNADINSSAAIAYSKLAALTASRALVSSAGGVVSVSAVTATELAYLAGVTGVTGSGNLVLDNAPTFSGAPTATRYEASGSDNYLLKSTLGTHGVYWNNTGSALELYVGGGARLSATTTTMALNGIVTGSTSNNSTITHIFENTNVGSSAIGRLQLRSDAIQVGFQAGSTAQGGTPLIGTFSSHALGIITGGSTRATISTAGLWVFNTAVNANEAFTFNGTGTSIDASSDVIFSLQFSDDADPTNGRYIRFGRSGNAAIGSINAASDSSVNYLTSSDTRLKSNQRPIEFGLAQLRKMQPKHFEWTNGMTDFGLIAQELIDVLPGALCVNVPDTEKEFWSVDYSKLTPILVRGVQELADRLDELEALVRGRV